MNRESNFAGAEVAKKRCDCTPLETTASSPHLRLFPANAQVGGLGRPRTELPSLPRQTKRSGRKRNRTKRGSGLPTVLIADDEPAMLRFLKAGLSSQAYEVLEATTAKEALATVVRDQPDLLILELALPDTDGMEIIRDLRAQGSGISIVVVTSRTDHSTKIAALNLGADDFITKPFCLDELLARVRLALRHRLQEKREKPIFRTGELCVDLVGRLVTRQGQEISLSRMEYDLLRLLVVHAGKVLTHSFILSEVWGPDGDVRYLRIYVRLLRGKIEVDPKHPRLLQSKIGVGYCLRVLDEEGTF
jgi:two-component system, OmpR family, KDP operon response regulator KdpE